MTAEQRAAEQAAELERMTTGEMTEREAIERAAAWKQVCAVSGKSGRDAGEKASGGRGRPAVPMTSRRPVGWSAASSRETMQEVRVIVRLTIHPAWSQTAGDAQSPFPL